MKQLSIRNITAGLLVLCLAPALISCAAETPTSGDTMTDAESQTTPANTTETTTNTATYLTDQQAASLTDFALSLTRASNTSQQNTLLSPLSVQQALGMVANGAREGTLTQMEEVMGLPLGELNVCLRLTNPTLAGSSTSSNAADAGGTADEKAATGPLKLANSLWVKDDFPLEQSFLQTNATFYNAGAFSVPFNSQTISDINAWVSEHTDGMIGNIVNEIPPEAVLFLINALAFEDAWAHPYQSEQVQEDTFTTQDGSSTTAEFMYSTESTYLEGEGVTGFVKGYDDARYAFVGLLPDEGTSTDEVLARLSGESLRNLLTGVPGTIADAALPKFTAEYETELKNTLATLGMPDAFNDKIANFTGLSTEDGLAIDQIKHKTFIEVDEQGTKAAAATSISMSVTSIAPQPDPEVKEVHLTRPFVYMIVDRTYDVPLFIGTVQNPA